MFSVHTQLQNHKREQTIAADKFAQIKVPVHLHTPYCMFLQLLLFVDHVVFTYLHVAVYIAYLSLCSS